MKKIQICLLLAAALLQSCSNYTNIKTEGALTPGDYVNYRYLMNNMELLERSVDIPDFTSDDAEYNTLQLQQSLGAANLRAYTWAEQFFDVNTADPDWRLSYAALYPANLVIQDVMKSSGGTISQKKQLVAEARVHRAYSYFTLVNEYGKQYNEATNATDPGVPLITAADVSITPVRTNVKAVYDLVISDLQAAIPDLPPLNTHNIYPSKAGAYALFARVYLQMGKYTEAGLYADSALALQHQLIDLAKITAVPLRLDNPEIILSKKAGASHTYGAMQVLSSSLLALYDKKDLRYTLFTTDYVNGGVTYRTNKVESINYETRNIGPGVPEMLLIKAETQARAGDAAAAMATINTLRQKRFAAADYIALTATDKDDALRKVIAERRRELCFKCLRWFDMKRLSSEAAFAQSLTRTDLATGQSTTLTPGSNRYVFPIPAYNIQLNPALEQNPR